MKDLTIVCEGLHGSKIVAQPWKHVIELACRLKGLGVNVNLISDKLPGVNESNEIHSIPVTRVEKKRFLMDFNSLYSELSRKSDLINWHCSDLWSAYYFSKLGSVSSNVIWTLHSGILSYRDVQVLSTQDRLHLANFWNNFLSASLPKSLLRKWLDVPLLKHIITLSNRTALRLENDYQIKNEKITHIPSGVDVNLFKALHSFERDSKNILYFGPLSTYRGFDTLLSAYAHISDTMPSTTLTVLARSANPNDAWVIKAKALKNVNVVTGVLDSQSLTHYLRAASVIALPFKFWPQVECPTTILEAMSMQKAIVTTSIGAIPEIISNRKTGIVVPPGDAKSLSAALLYLLKNTVLCQKIALNARKHVEQYYDWDIIAKRNLKIFEHYNN